MNQAAIILARIGFAIVLIGMLASLIGCSPAPDRPGDDYQAPTFDHYPDTIRYLIGPRGYEAWEFRTADGSRCILANASSGTGIACEWRPSPEHY